MTVSDTSSDLRYNVPVDLPKPDGRHFTLLVGSYVSKSQRGTDSASKPMVTARVTPSGYPAQPEAPVMSYKETTQEFRKRRRAEKAQWHAKLKVWRSQNPRPENKPKAKKRGMPPNGYEMTKKIRSDKGIMFQSHDDSWYFGTYYPLHSEVDHIPLDPKEYYGVIDKLRARAYGSGFHPGVTGAESLKAIKMITGAATQLRLGIASLATGDWRGLIRNVGSPQTPREWIRAKRDFIAYNEGRKTLSKAWLAFQYGWKPLVKDIDDAGAFVAEQLHGGAAAASRKVTAKKEFERTQFEPVSLFKMFGLQKKVTTTKVRLSVSAIDVAQMQSPLPSPANLAGIAWEVLPYSFVCDWVAPIGGYLQALRTSNDIRGTVVTTVFQVTEFSEPGLYSYAKQKIDLSGNTASMTLVSMRRTTAGEIYVPSPLGSLHPSKVFSVWERAVSAVALLQNLSFSEIKKPGNHNGPRLKWR